MSDKRHIFTGGEEHTAESLRDIADRLDVIASKSLPSIAAAAAKKAERLYEHCWLDESGWVAAYADSLVQRSSQAAHEHFLGSAGGGDRKVMREHALYAAAAAIALVDAIDRSGDES